MESVSPRARREQQDVPALRKSIEQELALLVAEKEPAALYEPVRYVLSGGGKRLRPLIVLLTARGFAVSAADAMPSALAVEVFHNFTLVHDDIMDHARERRGRATVHSQWNEATAILAGDYLMSLAYGLLAAGPVDRLREQMAVFQEMVRELCEGQTLDEVFESRLDVTVDEYLDMIDRKTGALLRCCLELGGILGGASDENRSTLRDAGVLIGRAFQIQDDLLDVIADDKRWGKRVGGDLIEGKRTYLLLTALDRSQGADRAWFQRILDDGGLALDLVPEARLRMERVGILDEARHRVADYTRRALDRLADVSEQAHLADVAELFEGLTARGH